MGVNIYSTKKDFLAGIRKIQNDIARQDNSIVDEDGNFLFTLATKFKWGRHKGNQLRDVFKVDPTYIEWCLQNASGFAIYEDDLMKLFNVSIFDKNDLNKICISESNNIIQLDLSVLKRDGNGFLIGNSIIKDHAYEFDKNYIEINREKIKNGIDSNNYQFGYPTESGINFSVLFQSKIGYKINIIVSN